MLGFMALRRSGSRRGSTCDVLHIGWSGDIGGAERQIELLVTTGAKAGRLSHRAFLIDGRGPIGDALDCAGLADRLFLTSIDSVSGHLRLFNRLRAINPEYVHLHVPLPLRTLAVAWLALPRARWVYREGNGGALIRDGQHRRFYRVVRNRFHAFQAVSPAMADCIEAYGVDPRRIVLVPNAVRVAIRVQPAPELQDGEPLVVGVVTRVERAGGKCIGTFVDVIAELRRRGVSCVGQIVGDGPDRLALERQTSAGVCAGAVTFLGAQAETTQFLDRFHLYLSTASREVFGNAAFEAFARGIPVVAMPCPGGMADAVRQVGVLLADRSVSSAADAIEELGASVSKRRLLQERGYRLLEDHLPKTVIKRLETLYDSI